MLPVADLRGGKRKLKLPRGLPESLGIRLRSSGISCSCYTDETIFID